MIGLLIFTLVVLCIVGLVVWGVRAIPLPPPVGIIAQVLICIVGVILIAQKAGVF